MESRSFTRPEDIPDEAVLYEALGFEDPDEQETVAVFSDAMKQAGLSDKAVQNLLGFRVLHMSLLRIREMASVKEKVYELLRWVYEHQKSALYCLQTGKIVDETVCESSPVSFAEQHGVSRDLFIDELMKRGVPRSRANLIWSIMDHFSLLELFSHIERDVHEALKATLVDFGVDLPLELR